MRRRVLLNSVRRQLRADEELLEAAFMWSRHRLMIPFALAAFAGMVVVAALAGFDGWMSRLGVGVAGGALAAMATTNYRVLARTDRGFVLLRASRVRQYAVETLERWPAGIELTALTSYSIATDWMVEDRRYTVPKSSEQSMTRMAVDL